MTVLPLDISAQPGTRGMLPAAHWLTGQPAPPRWLPGQADNFPFSRSFRHSRLRDAKVTGEGLAAASHCSALLRPDPSQFLPYRSLGARGTSPANFLRSRLRAGFPAVQIRFRSALRVDLSRICFFESSGKRFGRGSILSSGVEVSCGLWILRLFGRL